MAEYIEKEALIKAIEADFSTDWADYASKNNFGEYYIDGARDEYDDVLSIICQQKSTDVQPFKWVSVDDSLPPDNKPCVVMTENNGLGVSRLMGRNRIEWTLFGEPVLFWLPIPELPETTKG